MNNSRKKGDKHTKIAFREWIKLAMWEVEQGSFGYLMPEIYPIVV